jgi:hypothetical protein
VVVALGIMIFVIVVHYTQKSGDEEAFNQAGGDAAFM